MRCFRQSPEGTARSSQQSLIDTAPPPDLQGPAAQALSDVQLIIVWSAREPGRVGQSVLCRPGHTYVLGRAPQLLPQEESLCFVPARPSLCTVGRTEPRPSRDIQGEALSRRQLQFTWEGDALWVRNIGRCPLWINGLLQGRARLQHGDCLHLQNQLVLLVLRGDQATLPAARLAADSRSEFGAADADGLVGESSAMWHLRQQIAQHGPTEDHVLIVGPSGSGKELVAQALVRHSLRAERALISENVSTLPSSLASTLLFGNRRNFPNPGMEERPGLVGLAEGGTLFLDELGDMGSDVQPLLLRVMDPCGEYLRMGDEAKPRRANVRFVAATNHPERLRPELRRRFPREIHLPGLDARCQDTPLLARHLFQRQRQRRPDLERFMDGPHLRMDPRFVEQLVRHHYTTHVAELAFLLETSVSCSPGGFLLPLSSEALQRRAEPRVPDRVATDPSTAQLHAVNPVRSAELPSADAAQQALDSASGSVVQAAKLLGINRHQLNRMIRRHSLVLDRKTKKESAPGA